MAKLKRLFETFGKLQVSGSSPYYRQVLQETAHLSLVLQSRNVLITDITSTVDECILSLDKIHEQEADLPFEYTEDDSGDIIMTAKGTNLPTQVFKENHTLTEKQLKKISNYIHMHISDRKITKVKAGKFGIKKVKESLIPNISTSINNDINVGQRKCHSDCCLCYSGPHYVGFR